MWPPHRASTRRCVVLCRFQPVKSATAMPNAPYSMPCRNVSPGVCAAARRSPADESVAECDAGHFVGFVIFPRTALAKGVIERRAARIDASNLISHPHSCDATVDTFDYDLRFRTQLDPDRATVRFFDIGGCTLLVLK